jgi:hypothetical protein
MMTMAGISESGISAGSDTPMPAELVKKYLEQSKKTGGNRLVSFKSLVTNQTTSVYMDRFYLQPPQDVRGFMPVGFDDNPNNQYARVAGGKSFALGDAGRSRGDNAKGGSGTTRNFAWGMATSWRNDVWGRYFKDIGSHGVRGEIKILAESLGGAPVAAAMTPFVF